MPQRAIAPSTILFVLSRIAHKTLFVGSQPFEIEQHDSYVASSIGISVYPVDLNRFDELLKHAGVAMRAVVDRARADSVEPWSAIRAPPRSIHAIIGFRAPPASRSSSKAWFVRATRVPRRARLRDSTLIDWTFAHASCSIQLR